MTNDQYQEMVQEEEGAKLGDPRRCSRHLHVRTSSPDGMFDVPCHICESKMDEMDDEEFYDHEMGRSVRAWQELAAATPESGLTDSDILF